MIMTPQQEIDTVELIRSKYRFYGVSTALLDSNTDNIDDFMVLGRVGLAAIESVAWPADAYYIQRVDFPAFVRRVFPPERGMEVDCTFEGCLSELRQRIPQFYYYVTTWPASTLS